MELISLRPLWFLLLIVVLLVGYRYSLVDAKPWKRISSLALRILGLVCLIIAICRPFLLTQTEELHVIFLMDVSQSVDLDSATQSLAKIEASVEKLNNADSWSLHAIGNGTKKFDSVEQLRGWLTSWKESGADDAFRSATRIGESLLKTRMDFPTGKVKRVVLFSDGQATEGALSDALRQLRDEEIEVAFQPLETLSFPEAAVVALRPSTTKAFYGEVVRMSVQVQVNQPIKGSLRMIHRGVAVQEQDVELSPTQANRFHFDVDMVTPGSSRWTAELIPDKDHFPVNNQQTCTVEVRGRPRVLVLHQKEQEMRDFVRALKEQDFEIEVRGKYGVPNTIENLLAFDGIVIADMPATVMTPREMDLLKRYVVDFGGGLAMLGSEDSFGLGGYHKTPVEEVLPLVSRFEKEKEKPSLAMVLVIDKSGSMQGLPIALARQAAKAAAELIGARDQIGVVGFDSQPYMISEMRTGLEQDAIGAAIDSLAAGGGTNMFPGMLVGKEMLENTSAKIKHMICLSDGHTEPADHAGLTQQMVDSGITVSTVALGDADRNLLATIAEIGRGRYYETNDPANVPQIFTKETMQASKSAIKEDLFGSVQTGDHPALAGFEQADLPFTLGYVMTQQKPTAQMLLVTETGDPLLAVSRFGLGTGMAYTSDLSDRWGGEWLAWGECGKFWGQILRGIIRKNDASGIQVNSQFAQDNWLLNIRRTDTAGKLQSQVEWELTVLNEQGEEATVPVTETGLGQYRASVPIEKNSDLTLRLRDLDSNKLKVLHYDRAYPQEYALKQKRPESLKQVESIEADEIREGLTPQKTRKSIAWMFYIAALVSLLTGNLIRRL